VQVSRLSKGLSQRYRELFRAAKFGIAGAIGFLVVELILTIGVFFIYHNLSIPSTSFSSPTLLGLNALAFFVGVTCAFFINEKITVEKEVLAERRGAKNLVIRLFKFQLVYVAGNAVTVGVQLALLAALSLAPSVGNIIGAIIAFPLSYFISMRVVWNRPAMARSGKAEGESKST